MLMRLPSGAVVCEHPALEGIHHLRVHVADVRRSARWYTRNLGGKQLEFIGGPGRGCPSVSASICSSASPVTRGCETEGAVSGHATA